VAWAAVAGSRTLLRVGEAGKTTRSFGFNGHKPDVVPIGKRGPDWTMPPFGGEIKTALCNGACTNRYESVWPPSGEAASTLVREINTARRSIVLAINRRRGAEGIEAPAHALDYM